jgi:hypothetical protein
VLLPVMLVMLLHGGKLLLQPFHLWVISNVYVIKVVRWQRVSSPRGL